MSSIENMSSTEFSGERDEGLNPVNYTCYQCGHSCGHTFDDVGFEGLMPDEIECPKCGGPSTPNRKVEWFSVAIYLEDRKFGGHEEGGWYYDAGIPSPEAVHVQWMRIFTDEEQAIQYRRKLNIACDMWLNPGRRPTSSVLSEGRYRAQITDGDYPRPYPAQRPMYE